MSNLLDTIFKNNSPLQKLNYMNGNSAPVLKTTPKEENPLFPIFRKKHEDDLLSGEYDCLHLTPENETTYLLGAMRGVSYATEIHQKELKELQEKFDRLCAPTLERQDT